MPPPPCPCTPPPPDDPDLPEALLPLDWPGRELAAVMHEAQRAFVPLMDDYARAVVAG